MGRPINTGSATDPFKTSKNKTLCCYTKANREYTLQFAAYHVLFSGRLFLITASKRRRSLKDPFTGEIALWLLLSLLIELFLLKT